MGPAGTSGDGGGEREMRLFVALEIPPAVRDAVAGELGRYRRGVPAARWVRPEAWHVTLAFLGPVGEGAVTDLETALEPVFGGFREFELRLSAGGSFPPRRPARVLWLGLESEPQGALEALQAEVATALVEAGFGLDEKPFHAHLTLARCNPPWPRGATERFAQAASQPPAERFAVRRGVLFESHLGPDGARYEIRALFPMAEETRP